MDDDAGPSTRPKQSSNPSSAPSMSRPASHEGSQEGPSGSSSFFQSPSVSNTFAVGDANTSTVTILSRWLIVPTPTTKSPTEGTKIPAGTTTTLTKS
ncbi:hypothetical protein Goshw_004720 [Gossypium schwendimanii]|uniref:Uncharacterized protein n=1 Tax=Gossypium schwendimanii TaxID=34291 RepID=A0A7J9N7L7_GOSSC|nr:hypothetical protein [Gossypium schwendimanii]